MKYIIILIKEIAYQIFKALVSFRTGTIYVLRYYLAAS